MEAGCPARSGRRVRRERVVAQEDFACGACNLLGRCGIQAVMSRRDFGAGILSIAIAGRALGAGAPGAEPLLYLATRGRARVFILGFGDAQDDSWMTTRVRRALEASSELCLEVSHDAG